MSETDPSRDFFAPQRAHRLLWLVPLALLLLGVGLFAWTAVACRSGYEIATATAAGLLAIADAVVLALTFAIRRFDSPRGALKPTLGVLGVTALLGALTIPDLGSDRGRQKRTMGYMRTIATAMESRSGGRPEYPIAHAGDIEALARELEPTYVKVLPRRDGWDHEILVESDGKSYTITSYGLCCEPDGPEVHVSPNGGTTSYRSDIVFANGSFVQFPDGTQL